MIPRFIIAVLVTASLAVAQAELAPPTTPVGPQLGWRVLALPDLDGDGIADYAAAAPTDGTLGPNFAGRVDVYSGANDALVWWLFGASASEKIGYGLGLADWTGDGVDELVVVHQATPTPTTPFLSLHDLATGAVVASLPLPATVPWIEIGANIDAADLDGDGAEEILVTAAGSDSASFVLNRPPGAIVVFYANGTPPVVVTDATVNDFGRSASFVEDFDADGIPDILVGAPAAGLVSTGAPLLNVGLVRALRGSTLTTWWDLWGGVTNNQLGAWMLALPDQDGDARGDLALIRMIANTTGNSFALEIRSGLNAAAISAATLPLGSYPRTRLRLLPDLDGDGGPEIAIGMMTGLTPNEEIDLFSLSDLRMIDQLAAPTSGLGYGHDFVVSPDTDGDGLDELIVGEPQALGTSGRVSRRALAPCLSALADGSPNHDLLRLDGSSQLPSRRLDLAIGQPFTIEVDPHPLLAAPTDFVIWGLLGVPDAASSYASPVGSFLFPPRAAAPGLPWLFCLSDSLGFDPAAIFPAAPGPWSLGAPFGLPMAIDITLQGVTVVGPSIEITNGILIHVR